ncbi:MAG: hypothetical protein ACO24O_07145, partial [Arenimonas sp.]
EFRIARRQDLPAVSRIAVARMPAGMMNICVDFRDSTAIQHGRGAISMCSGSLNHTVQTLSL